MQRKLQFLMSSIVCLLRQRSSSAANTTLEKVAQLSALSGNYSHAISAFEEIATDCLSKNLLKFNAKNHFMNALLCHLAQDDAVGAERALTKYSDQDYTFADSREGRLLRVRIRAFSSVASVSRVTSPARRGVWLPLPFRGSHGCCVAAL